MSILDIFLGFLTSAGGFIDMSNMVFNPQSAARFGYALLWPIVIGLIGAALYSEMCGRVAAITHKSVFDLVRQRTGLTLSMITLTSSTLLTIMMCIAETGGVAIVLRLFSGLPNHTTTALAVLALLIATWYLPFTFIEWIYGLFGISMAIFLVSAFMLHPDWSKVLHGLIPSVPHLPKASDYLIFAYFVVGLISSTLMPYEVYFYSSGGIEEDWSEKNLLTNRITSYGGYSLGAVFAISISIMSAILFFPSGISPNFVSTAVLGPATVFGQIGLLIALVGLLFVFGGAATETGLSGAYTISQFFGWNWGKHQKPRKTPRFSILWIAIFIIAFVILLTGVNPVQVTTYTVVFSVVAFPLTYLPILIVANDKEYMGKYKNKKITSLIGWIYFAIILIVAISAIPLLIITNGGNG